MSEQTLQVLYEEGPCLAVNKPAGIATQAPPGIESVETLVRSFWREREGKPGPIYVGVPHRLDRPVSGVLLFARHVRAAQRLAKQFESRLVEKTYTALVHSRLPDPSGTLHDYLRKVPDRAHVEVVNATDPGACLAELSFRLLENLGQLSLIDIVPATGRTHQIRVQLATRGCPIVGDEQYGAFPSDINLSTSRCDAVIALHARRLRFRHPMLPHHVTVTAELPSHWNAWLPQITARLFDLES